MTSSLIYSTQLVVLLCKTVIQQSSPKETDLTHGVHISGVFW